MLVINLSGADANQNSNQALPSDNTSSDICTIERPTGGETTLVALDDNTQYDFAFDLADIKDVSREDGALVCIFEDDSKIIFENINAVDPRIAELENSILTGQDKFLNSLDIIEKLTAMMEILEGKIIENDNDSVHHVEYTALESQVALQLASIEPSSDETLSIDVEACGPGDIDGKQLPDFASAETFGNIEPASGGSSGGGAGRSGYGFQSAADVVTLKLLPPTGPIIETALQYKANFPELHAVQNNVGVTSGPIASPPDLHVDMIVNNNVDSSYIKEDGQCTVPVTSAYSGGDGNEVMTLKVTGIDVSWSVTAPGWVNAGNGTYTLTLPAGQTVYNGQFTFKPPANSDVDMTGLKFTVNVYDPDNGITKTDQKEFSVYVDAVVDVPVLTVPTDIQQAWYYNYQSYKTPLAISSHVTDQDGSEVVTKIVIRLDVPFSKPVAPYFTLDDMGVGLNKGTEISPGVWEIAVNNGDTAAALNGLMLVVPGTMNYHAIHQSITGAHIGNITVISHVSEVRTGGNEWDLTDNSTTVIQNINLKFVITPLVLDLNGNGVDLVSLETGIKFDMTNDGIVDRTSWVGPHDGLLALDRNHDGLINNQSELFGDNATSVDGFANLAQYDTNNDGRIDANDAVYKDIIVWRDENQDGISQPGEKLSLSDFNIVAINLKSSVINEARGDNVIMHESTFIYGDGSEGKILDVGFNVKDGAALNEGAQIKGTDGHDTIYGTDGDDIITGGTGSDTLYGGAGADKFLFDAINKGVDVIRDFSLDEGDVLDFSSFFHNADTTQQAIDNFVFAREVDGGTIVSIDVNGTGNAANAVDIVALEGMHGLNVQELVQNGNIHLM